MHLSQCTLGAIVVETHIQSGRRIGHITGLTLNGSGHTIPVVRFADGVEHGCHHGNLCVLGEAAEPMSLPTTELGRVMIDIVTPFGPR